MKHLTFFVLVPALAFGFLSCSKPPEDNLSNQGFDDLQLNIPALSNDMRGKAALEKSIGNTLAILLQDGNVKSDFLKECLKQTDGDYNVNPDFVGRLLAANVTSMAPGRTSVNASSKLSNEVVAYKTLNFGEAPLFFYPKAETIEYRLGKRGKISFTNDIADASSLAAADIVQPISKFDPNDPDDPGYAIDPALYGQPGYPADTSKLIIVLGSTYNPETELAEGYALNDGGTALEYVGLVGEEFAWEHDVLVIGSEDVGTVQPESFSEEEPLFTVMAGRTENEPEYGGIIQITNLGAVEGWIAGKLELGYQVIAGLAGEIKQRRFAKVKRKHFKNKKWYDYNDFIANWDTSILGRHMIEHWIEFDDGGTNTTVNSSINVPPQCTGCPSTTINYSYQIDRNDEDLGRALVAFNDPKTLVRNITYANFKRK